jgi:hypothetical protein
MNSKRLVNYAAYATIAVCIMWGIGDVALGHDWPRWFDILAGTAFCVGFLYMNISQDLEMKRQRLMLEESHRARQKEHEQLCLHCGKPWQTKNAGGLEV